MKINIILLAISIINHQSYSDKNREGTTILKLETQDGTPLSTIPIVKMSFSLSLRQVYFMNLTL
jgi:predicted nucleic acid-binding protein